MASHTRGLQSSLYELGEELMEGLFLYGEAQCVHPVLCGQEMEGLRSYRLYHTGTKTYTHTCLKSMARTEGNVISFTTLSSKSLYFSL